MCGSHPIYFVDVVRETEGPGPSFPHDCSRFYSFFVTAETFAWFTGVALEPANLATELPLPDPL